MCVKDRITKLVIDNVKKLISDKLPELIEDAVNDCIYDIVDDEVNRVMDEKMNTSLEHISKVHGVPLDLLLRDLPDTDKCKGIKTTPEGKRRCIFKAVQDGYCKYHKSQGERIKKRSLPSINLHNHGSDRMFVRGCPGCEGSKELIDLCSFIGNE